MNTDFVNLLKPLVLNSTILANKDFVNTYNQVQITDWLTETRINHIAWTMVPSLTETKVSHLKCRSKFVVFIFGLVFAVVYFKSMLTESMFWFFSGWSSELQLKLPKRVPYMYDKF